jgi:hypothetical protein
MRKKLNAVLRYAVCINNEGYKASLEIGKLYRIIPDDQAASHGYIRVIDESGEDYGYSAKRFFPIELPRALEKALWPVSKMPITRSRIKLLHQRRREGAFH